MNKKSYATGIILTILFGPFGLLYSSIWAALFLLVLTFAIATLFPPAVLVMIPINIFFSWFTVKSHNEKCDETYSNIAAVVRTTGEGE